ncbi:uracil-DNA glycosylase [Brevundimonas sp. UYEF29]|uniref:uracil-DNA glycosylase family protein n=1 Tax=unclassified Brevundimonas TaxID=2622653 RepID=UPI0005F86162|nr:uracil-DNA glycosylase family protein [Brevundimonas sp. KM4]KJV42385.1 uracil-DNA glycosylase [Brevundimonas sp. KM4]
MTTDLQDILNDIRACRACAGVLPHTPRPVVWVFPETRLLICGQAPGRRVHESGLPFTDPSGDRLRDWMGVDYETFYADPRIGVAAQAFCYPGTAPKGGDYPPPTRCAELWRSQLLGALPQMELTLLVGGYAQTWALGDRAKRTMTDTVRAWREYAPDLLVLPHPSWRNTAWLKKNPWFETEVLPYLRERVRRILTSANPAAIRSCETDLPVVS